jgi:PAS domain S-box-containing protein
MKDEKALKVEKRVEDQVSSLRSEARERRKTEAAFRSSDEEFRHLAENINVVFWMTSPDLQQIHYVSPAYEHIFGRSTKSLYANPHQWIEAIRLEDREVVRAVFATLSDATPSISTEYQIERPDGQVRWVHVRGFQVRNAADELVRLTGIISDITDRRRTEQALRESEERFRFLNDLAEATRPLTDPERIMAITSQMLGEHLRVSRCAYAEVEKDGEKFTILHDYTNGVESTVGRYQLSLFGARAVAQLQRGQTLIIDSVEAELLPDEGADMFNAIGIKAILCCSMIKDGVLRAMMAVHQSVPRNWTPGEVAIVQEVGDRCWATIERQVGEEKLRRSVAGLVSATRQFASGDLTARTALKGNDELAEVGKAFDLMADRIEEDILRRAQVEEKLRESEKRFRNVFNLQFQFIAILSPEGRVLDINDLPLRAGGVTREEVTGCLFWETAWWRGLPAMRAAWPGRLEVAARTEGPVLSEDEFNVASGEVRVAAIAITAVKNAMGELECYIVQGNDITDRKRADADLENMHRELLDASRKAGMAEVATSVLHNVGNVLNSVNVSASIVMESIKKSKAANLVKVVALLREHEKDLGTFITSNAKGQQVPAYLAQLSEHLLADQKTTVMELNLLLKNIEHIKEIVAMQQGYARASGVREIINVQDLVEDGIRLNVDALNRHRVEIIREFEDVPLLNIDRHKILQIIVNLIRNAQQACQDSTRADRRLTVRIAHGGDRIRISVLDNGLGIPAENLTRIFNHGFTTRQDGHGFGLHSGALAAKELGGSLTAHSDGPGLGSAFTLELPCPQQENDHE